MGDLFDTYGLEENVGLHVILSNLLWWISVVIMIIAYRYRSIWNVGYAPWTYLFSGFLLFGIRELGHFSSSPVIASLRYIFGIWSAIFMTSAFVILYILLYKRKKISRVSKYLPIVLALIFLLFMIYLYLSGTGMDGIKDTMNTLEGLVWVLGSSMIIYMTFMLGTHSSGRFVGVFMFFQFSAYAAFLWKFLGLLEKLSWALPYSIREIIETVFGAFAIISIYLLTGMLRELSRDMHGNKR